MIDISVVMSVYNAEEYLKEAIDSIINQTFKNFEFIIIDDGSSDGSLSIIKSYADDRIVLIHQENQGLSKSLNKGISLAKGKFIARMDADDISFPERLEKQFNFMKNHPECVLLGANGNHVDKNGKYLYTSNLPTSWEEIKDKLPENYIFHSLAFFRKDVFIKVGGYNEKIIQYFEDKILWNEFAKLGEMQNLPEVLLAYRWVPNSISNLPHQKLMQMRAIANRVIATGITNEKDISYIKKLSISSNKERFGNYNLRLAATYLHQNKKITAIKHLLSCLYSAPLKTSVWLNLSFCFLPNPIIKILRKIKHKGQIPS